MQSGSFRESRAKGKQLGLLKEVVRSVDYGRKVFIYTIKHEGFVMVVKSYLFTPRVELGKTIFRATLHEGGLE